MIPSIPKTSCILLISGLVLAVFPFFSSGPKASPAGSGCTAKGCHAGIQDIVPPDLPMMNLIRQNGLRHRDMDGCVVCHGGNPEATRKESAHRGIPKSLSRAPGPKAFYPNPGAVHVAKNTCGVCHPGYVYRVERSLMNTGAGIIRGSLSAWGIGQDRGAVWGNHDTEDPDGPIPSGTTPEYESYMAELRRTFPENFPERLNRLPLPPVGEVDADFSKAAFIFARTECQSCHVQVKGLQPPGSYRGTGCAACHMGYGQDGIYRGEDKSIPGTAGHILRHRIVGNRKTGGIPVTTCQACHNRGKRIGTSFAGRMETASKVNVTADQGLRRHGKDYMPLLEDLHHRKKSREGNPEGGLLCQDCHTSMDIHGDGNIQGTTLAQVEIECTDCHGTPERFPWELPLGRGDEFGLPRKGSPRGVSDTRLLSGQQFGFDYKGEDGYILSARGNPLGNVVRIGNRVLVHSATGKDFSVPVLKTLEQEGKARPEATMAMGTVPAHLDRLECYTCHALWTPQIYGCDVKMDFSDPGHREIDWIRVAQDPAQAESLAPEKSLAVKTAVSSAYSRWETPVLGINGEGRISPLIPGVQVVTTVINTRGQIAAAGITARNPSEAEAAGQSQIPLAMDMAPAQPHTSAAKARSCESCHTCLKTLGFGIGGGIFPFSPDFSKVLNSEGIQTATVGAHWPSSRAFNKKETDRILRTGTCTGCHGREKTAGKGQTRANPQTPEDHTRLVEEILKKGSGR